MQEMRCVFHFLTDHGKERLKKTLFVKMTTSFILLLLLINTTSLTLLFQEEGATVSIVHHQTATQPRSFIKTSLHNEPIISEKFNNSTRTIIINYAPSQEKTPLTAAENTHIIQRIWFDLAHQNFTDDNDSIAYEDFLEMYLKNDKGFDILLLNGTNTWSAVNLNVSTDVVILPDLELALSSDEISNLVNFYESGGRIIIIGSADERDPLQKTEIHRQSLNKLLQETNAGITFRTDIPTGYFPIVELQWNANTSYLANLIKKGVSETLHGESLGFLDVKEDTNTKITSFIDLGTDIGGIRYPIVAAEHVGLGKIFVIGTETPFLRATSVNTLFWDKLIEWLETPILIPTLDLPSEWFTDENRGINISITTPFTHNFQWSVNYTVQELITKATLTDQIGVKINHSDPIQENVQFRTPIAESNLTFELTISLGMINSNLTLTNAYHLLRFIEVKVAYNVSEIVTNVGATVAQNSFEAEENDLMSFFIVLDNNKNEPINVTTQLISKNTSTIRLFSPDTFITIVEARKTDIILNITTKINPNVPLSFDKIDSISFLAILRISIDGNLVREEPFTLIFYKPILISMGENQFTLQQNEKISFTISLKNNRFDYVEARLDLKNARGFLSSFTLEQKQVKIAPKSTTKLTITMRHQTSIPYDSGTKRLFLTISIPKLQVEEEFTIIVRLSIAPNNILVGFIIPSLMIFLPPMFAFFSWRKKERAKIAIIDYIKDNKIAAVSVLVKEFRVKDGFVEEYLRSKEIKDAFPNGKYFSSVKTFVVIDEDLVKRFKELVDRSKILRLRDLKKEFNAPLEVSNLLLQIFVEKGYLEGEINEKKTGFVSWKFIEDTIYEGFEEGMLNLRQLEQTLELNQTRIRKIIIDLSKKKNIKIYPTELQDIYYTDSGIHLKVTQYLGKKLIASISDLAVHLKMERSTLQKALSRVDYYNLATFLDRSGELWIAVGHLTAAVVQAIQKRKQVSLQELASHLKIPGHLAKPLIDSLLRSKMIRGGFIGKDTFVEELWIIDQLRTTLPFKEVANLHQISREMEINYEAVFEAVKRMINMGILIGFVDKTGTYHEIDHPTIDISTTQEDAQIRPVPRLRSSLQFLKGDINYHIEITNTTNEVLINPTIDVYFEDTFLYPLKTDPENVGKIVPPSTKNEKWRFYAKLPNILPNQSNSVSFRFEPLHLGRTIIRAFLQYESGVTGEQVGISVPRIVFDVKSPTNMVPTEQSIASCKNLLSSLPSDFKKIVLSEPAKVKDAFEVLISIINKKNFKIIGRTKTSDSENEWEEEAWFYASMPSESGNEIPIVIRADGSVLTGSLQVEIATKEENLITPLLLTIVEELNEEAKKRAGTETKQAYGRLKSQECNTCGAPLETLPTIGKDVKCEFCGTIYTFELLA